MKTKTNRLTRTNRNRPTIQAAKTKKRNHVLAVVVAAVAVEVDADDGRLALKTSKKKQSLRTKKLRQTKANFCSETTTKRLKSKSKPKPKSNQSLAVVAVAAPRGTKKLTRSLKKSETHVAVVVNLALPKVVKKKLREPVGVVGRNRVSPANLTMYRLGKKPFPAWKLSLPARVVIAEVAVVAVAIAVVDVAIR